MNLQASLFLVPHPRDILDRWLHPWRRKATIIIRKHPVTVVLTARAERALNQRSKPLIAEMQLYFSCMVKKRVLFHDSAEFDTVRVSDRLQVAFRAVQATTCDPWEFARNFPVKQELTTEQASKMYPRRLQVDYRNGDWSAQFFV